MQVQNDNFVGVAEETQFFVGHFCGQMMHCCHLTYHTFQLIRVVLNLRISGLNWLQSVSLRSQLLLLVLEILNPIGQIGTFYLFAAKVVQFVRGFHDSVPAKLNQTYVFLNLFLLFEDVGFLHLHRLSIFHLHLCLLVQQLFHNLVKIVVNLSHYFKFALFKVLSQFVTLCEHMVRFP